MKKTITLYSLNPDEYPNIEKEFEVIDNVKEQLDEITTQSPIKAVKVARVQARRVKAGEQVDTRPRVIVDGKEYTFIETKQIVSQEQAQKGAVAVINPDGEEYLMSEEKFNKKYIKTQGGFKAIDGPKHFRIVTKDCVITASWGEEQFVPKGSVLCVENVDDIYSVTNSAFQHTYSTDPKDFDLGMEY